MSKKCIKCGSIINDDSNYCPLCVKKAQHESINKEQSNNDNKANSSNAESVLIFIAYSILILGVMVSVGLLGTGYNIITAFSLLISSVVTWSVLKVICNISNNLHEINSKMKK